MKKENAKVSALLDSQVLNLGKKHSQPMDKIWKEETFVLKFRMTEEDLEVEVIEGKEISIEEKIEAKDQITEVIEEEEETEVQEEEEASEEEETKAMDPTFLKSYLYL